MNLRERRERLGMTQQQLAVALQASEDTLRRWEAMPRPPWRTHLAMLWIEHEAHMSRVDEEIKKFQQGFAYRPPSAHPNERRSEGVE